MSIEPAQLQGHLEGLVLAVLSARPAHGYEVVRRLAHESGGALDLPEGTVYPALHRLEAAGLLASRWHVVDGRRRRIYQLTAAGRDRLGERRAGWRRFVQVVERVLGAGTPAAPPVPPAPTGEAGS